MSSSTQSSPSFWHGRDTSISTVLVTGASGCLGSSLALRLAAAGHRLRVLRRPTSDLGFLPPSAALECTGDICDREVLRDAMQGCDTVYHTAAVVSFARSAEREQMRVNVEGTRAVVEACLATGVGTLVHTSSVTTIGYPPPGSHSSEETPVERSTARGYKLSKLLAEDEVASGVAHGLRAVIVNPSVIMGERDTRFHAGQLIRDIYKGRIPFYVDGGMNIVYAGDVAAGMIAAADRGENGERYILAGENLTHREIFRIVAEVTGGRPPLGKLPLGLLRGAGHAVEGVSALLGIAPPLTADIAAVAGRFNWYSSKKARRILAFTSIPLQETIRAAFRWYVENGYLQARR